jgi:hypothetical protein
MKFVCESANIFVFAVYWLKACQLCALHVQKFSAGLYISDAQYFIVFYDVTVT